MAWSSGWGVPGSLNDQHTSNDSSATAPRPPRLQGRYGDASAEASQSRSPPREGLSRRQSPERRQTPTTSSYRSGQNAVTTSATAAPLQDPSLDYPAPSSQRGYPPPATQQNERRAPPSAFAPHQHVNPQHLAHHHQHHHHHQQYQQQQYQQQQYQQQQYPQQQHQYLHQHHLRQGHPIQQQWAEEAQPTLPSLPTFDAGYYTAPQVNGYARGSGPSAAPRGLNDDRSYAVAHDDTSLGRSGTDDSGTAAANERLVHQVQELHQGLLRYRTALQEERQRREAAEARVAELERRTHLLVATSVEQRQLQALPPTTSPFVGNNSSVASHMKPMHQAPSFQAPPLQVQQPQTQQVQQQQQLLARLEVLENMNELLRQRYYAAAGSDVVPVPS